MDTAICVPVRTDLPRVMNMILSRSSPWTGSELQYFGLKLCILLMIGKKDSAKTSCGAVLEMRIISQNRHNSDTKMGVEDEDIIFAVYVSLPLSISLGAVDAFALFSCWNNVSANRNQQRRTFL